MDAKLRRAEVLPTHSPELFERAVAKAAALLKAGEVVAVPTETVYGLAANALNAEAVHRIYEAKGRPAHNPIIVHVASLQMARESTAKWDATAGALSQAFWPGPLTLVMQKAPNIPGIVSAGGETVGLRWPSHPFIQALIQRCGFPLAAPSANLSNRLSPTCAEHVTNQLGDRIPLIIDGGPCHVGIESTVLDVTTSPARILRPGIIGQASLTAVAGEVREGAEPGHVLRSPGLLARHYAPRARLLVTQWETDQELLTHIHETGIPSSETHLLVHQNIPSAAVFSRVAVIPHDPPAFARALYAELHRCDELGAGLIVVEAPPNEEEWRAVHDRLRRAAA